MAALSADGLFEVQPGILTPAFVAVIQLAVGIRGPDHLRQSVGQQTKACLAVAHGFLARFSSVTS